MRNKKLVCVLALITLLSSGTMVLAANANEKGDLEALTAEQIFEMSNNERLTYQGKIEALTDSEFDAFIVDLLKTTEDRDNLKNALSSLGIEIWTPSNDQLSITPRTEAYEADVSVTITRRYPDSYYRIIASAQLNKTEYKPGSYDLLTIYFDSTKASLFSYADSTYTALKSAQYAKDGTVVFNFYDKLAGTTADWAAVYVTPKSGMDNQWIDVGVDWVHTFTTTTTSVTPVVDLGFGGRGLVDGSVGISWTSSDLELNWSIADLNAFQA